MDNVFDSLGTIVEFSIGLAGFTGIVAVVRRFRGIDSNLARFRFRNLLITAFLPGFFALLAITLASFNVDDNLSLRYASAAFAILMVPYFGLVLHTAPETKSNKLTFTMWTLGLTTLVFQLVFLFVLNSPGFFIAGLNIMLLQGAVFFSVLVLAAFEQTDPDQDFERRDG